MVIDQSNTNNYMYLSNYFVYINQPENILYLDGAKQNKMDHFIGIQDFVSNKTRQQIISETRKIKYQHQL